MRDRTSEANYLGVESVQVSQGCMVNTFSACTETMLTRSSEKYYHYRKISAVYGKPFGLDKVGLIPSRAVRPSKAWQKAQLGPVFSD